MGLVITWRCKSRLTKHFTVMAKQHEKRTATGIRLNKNGRPVNDVLKRNTILRFGILRESKK